jgi:ABC-type branched-subunit amino acid transport system permease subunit
MSSRSAESADSVTPVLPGVSRARSMWRLFFFLLFVAALFTPTLSAQYLSPEHAINQYFDPAYRLPQFNRFMALALFAISLDLIWGYTGLLSLGHGLFFGLGGYIIGWSLKLQQACMDASELFPPDPDRYNLAPGVRPDYMVWARVPAVPGWIAPLIDTWLAIGLALLLNTILAFAFGWIVFKRRIKGVYFSLITQALVLAVFYLVSNQLPYTGGVNGQNTLAYLDLPGIDVNFSNTKTAVSGATNTDPIVITTAAAHNLSTGDEVTIMGVEGNAAANRRSRITVSSDTTFSLDGVRGNGDYESEGSVIWYGSRNMYWLITGITAFFALFCYALVNSKFGKILTAIRDNEFRVQALGYNTALYKTAVFAFSGFMAALAGVLYVAANQTASPTFFFINDSIEVVIFVAVGGRGTLVGAIIGALLVNWGRDYINTAFAEWWPVVLGGLFVAVVLFLPEGIVGGVPRFFKFVRIWIHGRPGLSATWNVARIGIALLYWGLVGVLASIPLPLAVFVRQIVWWVSGQWLNLDNPRTWMMSAPCGVAACGVAFVGHLLACAVPSEARARRFVIGSLGALAALVIVAQTVAAPLEQARRLVSYDGFGDLNLLQLVCLGLLPVACIALLGLFVRAIAAFYQHEALANSVRSFLMLLAALVVANVFLNYTVKLTNEPPELGPTLEYLEWLVHPFIGPFVFLVKMTYVVMLLMLPFWLLRLLYQAHECINRPSVLSAGQATDKPKPGVPALAKI